MYRNLAFICVQRMDIIFPCTKLSDVKLDGATLVKASKQDSSETLKLVVKLPSLSEYVADF